MPAIRQLVFVQSWDATVKSHQRSHNKQLIGRHATSWPVVTPLIAAPAMTYFGSTAHLSSLKGICYVSIRLYLENLDMPRVEHVECTVDVYNTRIGRGADAVRELHDATRGRHETREHGVCGCALQQAAGDAILSGRLCRCVVHLICVAALAELLGQLPLLLEREGMWAES